MSTKHPRLNVTLNSEHMGLLASLAARQEKSLSAAARELIELALDLQEDAYFSALADKRDTTHTHWVSHKDAWK